jgi:hypothetical protein
MQLTRRELYDLVWARPMTKVAAELGISDVGLHKVCDKHRIPVPGRGYWAKVAAGQRPLKAHFREIIDQSLDRIEFVGSPLQSLPPAVAEAHEKAKAAAASAAPPMPIKANEGLHPLLELTRKAADKAKPNASGFVTLGGTKVVAAVITRAAVDRMLVVLDLLVCAAEARGYKFVHGPDTPHFVIDSETISFSVEEKQDRVRHQITEKEQKALDRWQVDNERRKRLRQWISDWDKPKIPEWDHVPNGLLTIALDKNNRCDGLRRRFSDIKRCKLETMIDSILVGAATCAASIKAQREEAERRHHAYQEQEKRRVEIERQNRLEQKRREFLAHQIDLFEDARRIETFVTAYTEQHPVSDLPESCQRLIEWARHYAQRLYAAIAPDQLVPVLDKHRLMVDSTDIYSWVKFD